MVSTTKQIGTGQHSTRAPESVGSPKTEMTKGRANDSQKTTTAPKADGFPYTMVSSAKPRTAREQAVDAYNRGNPSHSGGTQYETALEQQYGRIAAAEKNAGTEQRTIRRPKQAQ